MEITHDRQERRYTGVEDGAAACVLDYVDSGGIRAMTHTFTDQAFRGRGLAAVLVAHAVDDTAAEDLRIRAACSYVADWFDRHPERRHLLA